MAIPVDDVARPPKLSFHRAHPGPLCALSVTRLRNPDVQKGSCRPTPVEASPPLLCGRPTAGPTSDRSLRTSAALTKMFQLLRVADRVEMKDAPLDHRERDNRDDLAVESHHDAGLAVDLFDREGRRPFRERPPDDAKDAVPACNRSRRSAGHVAAGIERADNSWIKDLQE